MKRFIVFVLILALAAPATGATVRKSIFTPKKPVSVPDNVRVRMRAFLAVEASLVSLTASKPAPVDPPPPPDKKGVCTYCDGTGKSGDGLNVCAHCQGTGKEPKAVTMPEMLEHSAQMNEELIKRFDTQLSDRLDAIVNQLQDNFSEKLESLKPKTAAKPKAVAMPHYPIRGGNYWSGCGGWQHLTMGEHAGKFDHNWLRTLSNDEVQSLHSDDHDGQVKWNYVVRPQPVKVVDPPVATPAAPVAPAKPKAKPGIKWYFKSQQRGNCPGGFCPASIQTIEVTDERGYVIVESHAAR